MVSGPGRSVWALRTSYVLFCESELELEASESNGVGQGKNARKKGRQKREDEMSDSCKPVWRAKERGRTYYKS